MQRYNSNDSLPYSRIFAGKQVPEFSKNISNIFRKSASRTRKTEFSFIENSLHFSSKFDIFKRPNVYILCFYEK